MANIVELIIRGNDQSSRALASSVKNLQGMDSAVGSLRTSLARLVSAGALAALAKSAIDLGGELTDMSAKFGVSASELSALSYPAKMVGVDIEAVGNAFKFMQKNIAAAENPTSDAAIALKMLGVNLADLKNKTPMQQFLLLSDAFSRLERDENRTALALDLFGRAGADVLPVLEKGSAGLNKMTKAAQDLGIALTEEEIKNLDDYGDAIDRLSLRTKSFAGRAINELGEFYKWMTRQNDVSINLVAKLNDEYDKLLVKMGLYNPSIKAGKIADILVENPDKVKAGSSEAEKARIKSAEEARKKAAAAAERLKEDILKNDAAHSAAEGKIVHDALAAEMGMDQEYFDTRTKMRLDDFNEWKAGQEERLRFLVGVTAKEGEIVHDALLEEMSITEQAGKYRAEDAFNAAMMYGNTASAIRLLNEGLSEQFRIIDEGREKVSAYSRLYNFAFRDMDGITADLTHAAVDGFNRMTDALTDFVMTGKMQFRDFANSVISDIMRIAIQQSIVQPIARGFLGAFGFSMPIGPGKAAGGPVMPGMLYPVGERGIELFAPGVSGSIIPNGGGVGRGDVTVVIRNEGGQPVQAKSAKASFDLQGTVIDIVIDGIHRNVHGLRTALGGA